MDIFKELEEIIRKKASQKEERSYTQRLLSEKGLVERKLNEEAYEVVEASLQADRDHLITETADLLYHLLVLLCKGGVSLEEVLRELEGRKK